MDSSGRLARRRFLFSEINFDVDYPAGIKHQAADVLSRLATNGTNMPPVGNDLSLLAVLIVDDIDVIIHFLDAIDIARNPHDAMRIPSDTPHKILPTSTPTEFIREQAGGTYFHAITAPVGQANTNLTLNTTLVRQSPIDRAVQIIAPLSLRWCILTLAQYFTMAVHPGPS